jgi:AcrR family transcriptional regulator
VGVPPSSRDGARARGETARPSHDRILATAERVFAERGYADTSLRELIAACECSTTAFYARFATKAAVLESLLARLLDDLHDAAAAALPRARDLPQGFDRGVDVLVGALSGRRGLVRVALTEAATQPTTRAILRRAYGMLAALLAAHLAGQVARGRIELRDTDALAWAIVGALTMQVMRWAVFDELDDGALAAALRATARTMLPPSRRRAR